MQWLLILFFTLIISGCQGLQSVDTANSNHSESEDLIVINTSELGRKCPISHQQQEGFFIATGKRNSQPTYEHIDLKYLNSQTFNSTTTIPPHSAPDLWNVMGESFSLPVPNNKRIRYYRNWFVDNPLHIKTVSKRAEPFLYLMYEEVQKRGLPTEIVLLPFIESSFDQFAHSNKGASGLWQITAPTGKSFGLEYWQGYDGRRDVIASTHAALDLLEYLHDKFNGNWLHAIAAYNTGEARVRNAIKSNKKKGISTDFWYLELPKETRLYVPKLLAMADIVKHKQEYQYQLDFAMIPASPAVTKVIVNNSVRLKQIAKHADISSKQLYALNPGYTAGYTLKNRDNIVLLPKNNIEAFYNNIDSRLYVRHKYFIHKIKIGESLSELAHNNNTTVSRIKQANEMSNSFIIAGQRLLIPLID